MIIRSATMADAGAISAIYNHYVQHSTCTFQEDVETVADRERWMSAHAGGHVVLVAEEADGRIAAWGSLSPFNPRSAYRFTVENAVYLRDDCRGHGLGTRMLAALVARARQADFRVILAKISADQPASIALHTRSGFTEVGRLRGVGFKFGQWLDVLFMQADLRAAPGKPS